MKMINNIFSIFDPSSSYISLRWIILTIPTFILIVRVKNLPNKTGKLFILIKEKIEKEIINLIRNRKKIFSSNIIVIIFMLIIILNIIALMPFNFTVTAHLSVSLSISLSIWISIIIWGWLNSFKKIISHMTPIGTPNRLISFIVIIEIIRNIIRPITLSIRLSANIVAGHLLISLLSNFSNIRVINTQLTLIFILSLTVLEIIVAIVQAYVLRTLLTLYHNESL